MPLQQTDTMCRLLLLLFCASTCFAATKNTYFITSPKTIVKGAEFSLGVYIVNATSAVRVRAQLLEYLQNGSKTTRRVVKGDRGDFFMGRPGILKLKLPHDAIKTSQYRIRVRGRVGCEFEKEETITVHSQQASTLIQTDKAMYKGGQTVNFRVVTIYPDLKPFLETADVVIQDPKKNKLKQWEDLQFINGVITGSYQLGDAPREGHWTIQVTIPSLDGYAKAQAFTVQEYQLPKFEVKVELAPFGLYTDLEIRGTIKADYTFGKPVDGLVDLRAFAGNIYNSCGVEEKSVQQVIPINGEVSFRYSVSDIKKATSRTYGNLYHVQIVARVTEKVTGKVLNGTGEIRFYNNRHKLTFLQTSASTFKPGLPYKAYVKLTTQDDIPVVEDPMIAVPDSRRVQVYTCVDFERQAQNQNKYACHQFQGTYNLDSMFLRPDKNGIVEINYAEIPRNTTKIKIKAWYGNIFVTKNVNKAYSQTNNFIQISTYETSNAQNDDNINFEVRSTEPVHTVNYLVKARGTVEEVKTFDMKGGTYISINPRITSNMAPSAYILVYYIRKTGEVVADGLTFSVKHLFKHNVSLSYNKDKATPDESVDLVVKAEPRSQIFVLAVDQSVLLLKSGNDLTQAKVKKAMEDYSQVPNPITLHDWRFGHQSSSQKAKQFFDEAGVLVMSDTLAFDTPRRKYNAPRGYSSRRQHGPPGYGGGGYGGLPGYEAGTYDSPRMIQNIVSDSIPELVEVGRVRSIFPETWLWDNQTVSADGTALFSAKVPDTITSWVASAFGVHGSLGLGVAATTSKLLVEKTFFVSLNLPPSIKYGEVVTIQAIVFNYLDVDLPVTVSLPASRDYFNIAIDSNGDESDTSLDQSSTMIVASGTPTSAYFPIRPRTRDVIYLEVSAQSYRASDAVKRELLVKPEGIRRERNINTIVTPTQGKNFETKLFMDTPKNLVPDTMKFTISATWDLMGLSGVNLQNLIRLPTGCGEQNLMKFTPNIFIGDYLKSSGQMENYLQKKITQYLELGYQKQLTYQKHDWSYSPFGDSDGVGSTWLTAFVVRSFEQAKRYIYIDDLALARSVSWLLDRQSQDGSFSEQGTIIDNYLQNNQISLTAYVLLSLLEVDSKTLQQPVHQSYSYYDRKTTLAEVHGNVSTKATAYLESIVLDTDDVYSLAISTLALVKAKSKLADDAVRRIRSKLTETGGTEYLKVKADTNTKLSMPRPTTITSHDIIATSYALMSFIETESGNTRQEYNVMKFLVNQRNGHGGFQSSQDTVVALESLSKYATATIPDKFKMDINIVTDQGEKLILNIDTGNLLVMEVKQLTGPTREFTITARGSGLGFVDISAEYYVAGDDINDNFDISTVLLDDNLNGFTLMTCCKVLNNEPTGMATATLQIPAGFNPDLSSINVAGVRRVERSGNDVNIYFDEIGKTSTCISLQASRSSMVSNTRESYVQFTDYYQPSKTTTVSYLPRKLRDSKVCDVCPQCCNDSFK